MDFRNSQEATAVLMASGCVHYKEVSLDDLKQPLLEICDLPKSSAAGVRGRESSETSDDEIGVSRKTRPDLPCNETPENRETCGVEFGCQTDSKIDWADLSDMVGFSATFVEEAHSLFSDLLGKWARQRPNGRERFLWRARNSSHWVHFTAARMALSSPWESLTKGGNTDCQLRLRSRPHAVSSEERLPHVGPFHLYGKGT